MPAKLIDLTQLLNEKMLVYPDTTPPTFEVTNTVDRDGYREHHISMQSHTGTHIDAPRHILRDGRSLDKFPLDQFIGRAMVIDCRGRNEISGIKVYSVLAPPPAIDVGTLQVCI